VQGPLTDIFASVAPVQLADPAAFESALAELLARARAAWPQLSLSQDGFVRWIAARAKPDVDSLRALFAEDLYLAFGCAQHDGAALAALESAIQAAATAELRRMDDSGDLVSEALQQLRERLLAGPDARIHQYQGNGPFSGWLRIAAVRIAFNLRRRANVEVHAKRVLGAKLVEAPDPELEIIKQRYGEAVQYALQRALANLDVEHRQLMRLHYVDRVGLDKIAVMRRASKSTVWRWLAEARQSVLEQAKRILSADFGVRGDTLDSLLGLVVSRVNMSLSALVSQSEDG
jgi:RNA polymerase sigma-70 factor (ECF subfamily)